jgi:hypothetical protein
MIAEHDWQSCHAFPSNKANLHMPRGRLNGDHTSEATQWEVHGLNLCFGME